MNNIVCLLSLLFTKEQFSSLKVYCCQCAFCVTSCFYHDKLFLTLSWLYVDYCVDEQLLRVTAVDNEENN